ncbi:MAG: DUF934 domain-containing protein [Gammaproteobacteria bacterium]
MRVIKNRTIVQDRWQRVADDAPLPEGDVIVSFKRFQAEPQAFAGRAGRVAVWIEPADDVDALVPHLPRMDLVAISFPSFSDGRGFSHARLLRGRHGYRGELRAIGDVLRDQIYFMARCGIDSFEIRADRSAEDALKALDEFTVRYQSAADDAVPIWRLR